MTSHFPIPRLPSPALSFIPCLSLFIFPSSYLPSLAGTPVPAKDRGLCSGFPFPDFLIFPFRAFRMEIAVLRLALSLGLHRFQRAFRGNFCAPEIAENCPQIGDLSPIFSKMTGIFPRFPGILSAGKTGGKSRGKREKPGRNRKKWSKISEKQGTS